MATPKPYKYTEQPINLGAIMSLLNRVHAHEIMVDGAFNGDPHPGNILLLPDGRVGLIDYGQVKRINEEVRLNHARLVVALAKGDPDDVLDVYINRLGVKTKCVPPTPFAPAHHVACPAAPFPCPFLTPPPPPLTRDANHPLLFLAVPCPGLPLMRTGT